jgi:hypothetical protein
MIYTLDSPLYRHFLSGRTGNKTTEFGGVKKRGDKVKEKGSAGEDGRSG